MRNVLFVLVFVAAQLIFANTALASTCYQYAQVNCGSNCGWSYDSNTDTYAPGVGTTGLAQATANTFPSCAGGNVVIYGRKNFTAGGYADYYFSFIVNSGGNVGYSGDGDVSHDQNMVPPSYCQTHSCTGGVVGYGGYNYYGSVGDPVTVP